MPSTWFKAYQLEGDASHLRKAKVLLERYRSGLAEATGEHADWAARDKTRLYQSETLVFALSSTTLAANRVRFAA